MLWFHLLWYDGDEPSIKSWPKNIRADGWGRLVSIRQSAHAMLAILASKFFNSEAKIYVLVPMRDLNFMDTFTIPLLT